MTSVVRPAIRVRQRLCTSRLVLGVERACRLVEQQDGRRAGSRGRWRDALALAARQPRPAFAGLCVS